MKKIISLILTLCMMLSLVSVASAANVEDDPIIYLMGAAGEIYDAEGNQIHPIGADAGAVIKEALVPCLEQLALGYVKGDFEAYAEEFYNAFAPIYEKVKLDNNGEASDGSNCQWDVNTVGINDKKGDYRIFDYLFKYDWRLSPFQTAEELKTYIDRVKSATGKDKVNLVSRCYGSNVVATYLQMYKDHAVENVGKVLYYTPSIYGVTYLTAMFSGEIEFNGTAIDNFVDYYLANGDLFEDDETKALLDTLVTFLNQIRVLGIATDAVKSIVDDVKGDLIPKLLKASFGSWPSHWAMVLPEYYETAREFVFGDCEEEYAGLIEKIDAYYYDVQLKFEDTAKELTAKGIKFYNIVKYNSPAYPLSKEAVEQSDCYTTVADQSFGAVAAKYGETLSNKYIASIENKAYLSPDNIIDGSGALWKDTTWYIKDLFHDEFPGYIHDRMFIDIFRESLTAHNDKYPQFLQYDKASGIVNPLVVTEEEKEQEQIKQEENKWFTSIIRFFTAFFNFFAKLFRGELSFGDKEAA